MTFGNRVSGVPSSCFRCDHVEFGGGEVEGGGLAKSFGTLSILILNDY